MPNKIYYHDQHKINQIFEQVKALSDVVEELRIKVNDLKKISASMNYQNVFLESIRENNKIAYHIETCLPRKIETCFRNIEASTKTEETCPLTKNIQSSSTCVDSSTRVHCKNHCKKKKRKKSVIRLSRIYQNLKFLVVKNMQGVRKILRSSENYQCVCSQQPQVCVSEKEAKRECSESDLRDIDITKYTKISKELKYSSFLLDASTQTLIVHKIPCLWQNDDKALPIYYPLPRNLVENSVQVNLLSEIYYQSVSNDRLIIYSDRSSCRSSKNNVKRTSLSRKKVKRYKKCSCGKQCPYALYKLPCIEYRCDSPKRKINNGISALMLECSSFEERNNFPKFIGIDMAHKENDERSANILSFEIDKDRSSASSLSVEIDVHSNHCHFENQFLNQRRARTYITKRMNSRKNDKLIENASAEEKVFFNAISSQENIIGEQKQIDEAVKIISFQKKYVMPEDHCEYQTFLNESFVDNKRSRKNNTSIMLANKQIQCAIFATTVSRRKISVKTSTQDFYVQQNGGRNRNKQNKIRTMHK